MTKIASSDIHGNITALEVVLQMSAARVMNNGFWEIFC